MGSGMAVYGYARVSTDGQSLSAQLAELKAAKCAMMLTVLGGLAEFERELIRTRTGEVKEREGQEGKPRTNPGSTGGPLSAGEATAHEKRQARS